MNALDCKSCHDPTIVYEDNKSALCLANNKAVHPRSTHIDIKLHFIRECIDKGEVCLEYCPSENMVADMFTKPLPISKF